jgi:hypothetical protein
MIPVKITVKGDTARGRELIGFAKAEMAKLERLMSFQGLKQGSRTVSPFPGVVVECWSRFSLQEIVVHVAPGGEQGAESVVVEEEKRECLCFPHFSFGVIAAVHPEIPERESFDFAADYEAALVDYNEDLPAQLFQYDVEICYGPDYLKFEGAYDANFGRYNKGQYVLVTIGAEMEAWAVPLDCDRSCLVNSPRFDELIISPIHVNKKMDDKWVNEDAA